MPTSCFYFDGFCKSELEKRPNAFSSWLETTPDPLELVINGRMSEKDSLKSRWRRAKSWVNRLSQRPDTTIRILGYSMGCHLAVKFAAKLPAKRVGDLWLIAPDPKFRPTDLDKLKSPSAYKEAQDLWDTDGLPGDRFCSNLKRLSQLVIHVIYSRGDPVAVWDGNVKMMKHRCKGKEGDGFQWHDVRINSPARVGGVTFRLRPKKASSEFWIHQQLFTIARKSG